MSTFTTVGEAMPFLHVNLEKNDRVYAESGAMVTMESSIEMVGQTRGGLMSSLVRSIANDESFFHQNFSAPTKGGDIILAPIVPGEIQILDISSSSYLLNDGAFLAADDSVQIENVSQGVVNALGGGSGGFIVNRLHGKGSAAVSGLGNIFALDITPDQDMIIDNGHLVAWDDRLTYNVSLATENSGGIFKRLLNSVVSGEGLVTRFSGTGTVYVCSRNKASFLGWIGSSVQKMRS